jgi:O-antigen ligase
MSLTLQTWAMRLALYLALCGGALAFSFGADFERPKALCVALAAALLLPRALGNVAQLSVVLRLALGAWLLALVLSSVFALDPTRAVIGSYERSQGALLLGFCAILSLAQVPLPALRTPLLCACGLSALWAIAQSTGVEAWLFGHFGVYGWQGAQEFAYTGLHSAVPSRAFAGFGNPTALGGWLCLALPFLMAGQSAERRSVFHRVVLGLTVIALLLCGTRAAWGALALVALLGWHMERQKNTQKLPSTRAFLTVLACAVVALGALVALRPASVTQRGELMQAALHYLSAVEHTFSMPDPHPTVRPWLGVGADLQAVALTQARPPAGFTPDRAHQLLLDILLVGGWLGLTAWLALVWALWRTCFATAKLEAQACHDAQVSQSTRAERGALLALCAGLLVWQLGFSLSAEKALFALLLGGVLHTRTPQLPLVSLVTHKWHYPATLAAVVLACASYLPTAWLPNIPWRTPERAITHFTNAQNYIRQDQAERALRELQIAAALDPYRLDLARAQATLAAELAAP